MTTHSFAYNMCASLFAAGNESEKTLVGTINRLFAQPAWRAEFAYLGYADENSVLEALRPYDLGNGQLRKFNEGKIANSEYATELQKYLDLKVDETAAKAALKARGIEEKIKGYGSVSVTRNAVFNLLKKINGINF